MCRRHPTLTPPSPHPVEQGPQGEGDSLDSFMKDLRGTLSKSAKYEARQKIHHLRKASLWSGLVLCVLQGATSIPHLHTSCLQSLSHLPTSPPSSLPSYLLLSLPPSFPPSLPPSRPFSVLLLSLGRRILLETDQHCQTRWDSPLHKVPHAPPT